MYEGYIVLGILLVTCTKWWTMFNWN